MRLSFNNVSPRVILAVLAFSSMNGALMQTLLLPIQGELPELLDSSPATTSWVITATLLSAAICMPIFGRLGDMYGKRTMVLILLTSLVAGSVLAAVTTSVVGVIIGRAMQGAAMAITPLGIAIIRDVVSPQRLGTAIALVSATMGVGGALGMPAAAIVIDAFDWHMVFWVSALVGLTCMVLVLLVVPPDVKKTGGKFDLMGAIGLAAGLLSVLMAVSKGNEWGWGSSSIVGLFVAGFAILLIWGWYEMRAANPLVDLAVSSRAPVLLTNLAAVMAGFTLLASAVTYPQLLERPVSEGGLGMTLMQTGIILAPSGLMMLLISPIAGTIERRWGYRKFFIAGTFFLVAGYGLAVSTTASVSQVLIVNALIGLGVGCCYSAMPGMIMRAVPRHETGAANGLNALMRSVGTSTAAAVSAALITQTGEFTAVFAVGLCACVVAMILGFAIPKDTGDSLALNG